MTDKKAVGKTELSKKEETPVVATVAVVAVTEAPSVSTLMQPPGPHGFLDQPKGDMAVIPVANADAIFKNPRNRWEQRSDKKPLLSKVAQEVFTMGEFNKLDKGVVVMGALLEPCARDFDYDEWSTKRSSNHIENDEGIAHPSSHVLYSGMRSITERKLAKERKFDIYQFHIDKRLYTIYVGANAKLWLNARSDDYFYQMDQDLAKENIKRDGAVTVLAINTTLIDCTFFNVNVIANLNLSESVLSDSNITFPNPDEKPARSPWESGVRYVAPPKPLYERLFLERMSVHNSHLSAGAYFQGTIENTTIDGSSRVNTKDASVSGSTIKAGGRIFLGKTHITDATLTTEKDCLIANQSLRGKSIYAEGIYARNKLCITEITKISETYSDFILVKSDKDHMAFNAGGRPSTLKFRLLEDEAKLREDLQAHLIKLNQHNTFSGYGSEVPETVSPKSLDPITKSMFRYIIDSVISRVKIINAIDGTMIIARQVEYEDMSRHFGDYF